MVVGACKQVCVVRGGGGGSGRVQALLIWQRHGGERQIGDGHGGYSPECPVCSVIICGDGGVGVDVGRVVMVDLWCKHFNVIQMWVHTHLRALEQSSPCAHLHVPSSSPWLRVAYIAVVEVVECMCVVVWLQYH